MCCLWKAILWQPIPWQKLLCASLLLAAVAAHAQEQQTEGKNSGEQQAETQPPAAPAQGQENTQGADVFVPTEEISEDLSVSFPIDI